MPSGLKSPAFNPPTLPKTVKLLYIDQHTINFGLSFILFKTCVVVICHQFNFCCSHTRIKIGKAAVEDKIGPKMLKALNGKEVHWLTQVCQVAQNLQLTHVKLLKNFSSSYAFFKTWTVRNCHQFNLYYSCMKIKIWKSCW